MRTFSARETEWLQELDGIELAGFWQRAGAFAIDWLLIVIIFSSLATIAASSFIVIQHLRGKSVDIEKTVSDVPQGDAIVEKKLSNNLNLRVSKKAEKSPLTYVVNDIVIPIFYFGILLWKGRGRTPGKRIMKIRVVSLVHRHITFWHAVERALGYGAAALELGFGFLQFFIHPYRRCAQDRLAETIVVTERGYQAMQHKLEHPLIPDTAAEVAMSETAEALEPVQNP